MAEDVIEKLRRGKAAYDEALSERDKAVRYWRSHGMTQRDVAAKLRVTPAVVARIDLRTQEENDG